MDKEETRKRIIEEARSWIGTPYHHEARVKGAGVDCGMFILEVYERVRLIPHISPPHYSPDFMLHRNEEWYVSLILDYAKEINSVGILPGDAVVMKNGRIFSHGGIVIEWPLIIHASLPDRAVVYAEIDRHPLLQKKKRFFRHKELV